MILHGQNILAVASDFDGTIIKDVGSSFCVF